MIGNKVDVVRDKEHIVQIKIHPENKLQRTLAQ